MEREGRRALRGGGEEGRFRSQLVELGRILSFRIRKSLILEVRPSGRVISLSGPPEVQNGETDLDVDSDSSLSVSPNDNGLCCFSDA